MDNFVQSMRNLGPARLGAIAVVGFAVLGFFAYLTTRLSAPTMDLLYAELQASDAAVIAKKLDELKIPYKVDPSGTRITVASDQVGRARMQMAQAGLPSGGTVGYELFDKGEGFGATSFMQNLNHLRALEGEMARTIGTMAGVQQARVHLVLPKREMFSQSQNPATASVFLRLRGPGLSREQVSAVQHLLATAVPRLDPRQVTIVDDKGNVLARGGPADTVEAQAQGADERKVAYEQRLTRNIEDLVGRTVGYGKVRAQVNADMDFDRITTNSEVFDPEGQVVRSTQTVDEKSDSSDRDPMEGVTVGNNVPNSGQGDKSSSNPVTSNRTNRTEETTNFEISRTTKTHVREIGQVRRLTVAVLVDGVYSAAPAGGNPEAVYQPRSKTELDQISALVRSAVGFDAVRGDSLEVTNLRFAIPDEAMTQPGELIFGMPKEDVFRIAEMLILGVVAVLVILLVIRPLINRAFERPSVEEEDVEKLLAEQAQLPAQLAAPAGALAADLAQEAAQADEELEQMIDINRVEGRVRASSIRKVGEIVEKHPEEAVAILRSWLYQET